MFGIEGGELIALAVVALIVLGPEKLPRFAADAARLLRQLRRMATNAREDVRRELGPELQGISLEDLNPKTALRKHVLDDLDLDLDDDEKVRRGTRTFPGGASATGDGPSPPAPRYDPDAT